MPYFSVKKALGVGLLDQVVSSATNFAVPAIIAHIANAEDFGRFALSYSVFSVGILLIRPVAGSTLAIAYSDRDEVARASAFAVATTLAVLAGTVALFTAMQFGLGGTGSVVLGFATTALVVQDAIRMNAFADGTPVSALRNDLLMALLVVICLSALTLGRVLTPTNVVSVWGFAAIASAVVGVWQLKLQLSAIAMRGFLRENWSLSRNLLFEGIAVAVGGQAVVWICGLHSIQLAAAYRAAMQNVMGPAGVMLMALSPQLTVAFREFRLDRRMTAKLAIRASVLMGVAFPVLAAVIVSCPDDVGELLAGNVWHSAKGFVIPAGFVWGGVAALTIVTSSFRFHLRPSIIRNFRIVMLCFSLTSVSIGVAMYGRRGAEIMSVLSGSTTICLALVAFFFVEHRCDNLGKSSRHRRRQPEQELT